jgi:GH25 family lysozyme M1 (1,4-beta-N-acetylmuramidase)
MKEFFKSSCSTTVNFLHRKAPNRTSTSKDLKESNPIMSSRFQTSDKASMYKGKKEFTHFLRTGIEQRRKIN